MVDLTIKLYRHIPWCKVVFSISLLHCVADESDFIFSYSNDYTRKAANTRNLVGDIGVVSYKIGDKNARCEVESVTLI